MKKGGFFWGWWQEDKKRGKIMQEGGKNIYRERQKRDNCHMPCFLQQTAHWFWEIFKLT